MFSKEYDDLDDIEYTVTVIATIGYIIQDVSQDIVTVKNNFKIVKYLYFKTIYYLGYNFMLFE